MGIMQAELGITLDQHYAFGEDHGMRRELIDGILIVSAFATNRHALAVHRLEIALDEVCPPDLLVLGTINVDQEPATNLQPDLVVVRKADFDLAATEIRPLLVVEVLSPSTRRYDQTLKRRVYAGMGIGSYWLVDVAEPSIQVLELGDDGDYEERNRLVGEQRVSLGRPFPVTLAASELVQLK